MNIHIETQVPLTHRTTLGVGGNAAFFTTVRSIEELREASAYARAHALRLVVLGGGSNVVVSDNGIDGLVVHMALNDISMEVTNEHVLVTAGAGVSLDELVAQTVHEELWGMENLSGIPGSVGAVPIQNVGAYGVEAEDIIEYVDVYDTSTDECLRFTNAECNFGYRDSRFKRDDGKCYIVTAVTMRLSRTPKRQIGYKDLAAVFANTVEPSLQEIRDAVIIIRAGKFPDWRMIGTAGSFFKNPIITEEAYGELQKKFPEIPGFPQQYGVKIPLGWILDKVLNVRGYREGNVGLYEKQALVLVNHGGATAEEVITFSDSIIKKIFDATRIRVEREVVVLK